MPFVESLNIGAARPLTAKYGMSGIDKRALPGPIWVTDPGEHDGEGSGLAGDRVCDRDNHGGHDQAVYAYAREDLDRWQADLGRELPSGTFGENVTTSGLDVTGARIGERCRVGERVALQVTVPRIPCRTFAVWLGVRGWVKTFTRRAIPGAYLRVIRAGHLRSGDPVVVEQRPEHDVTVGMASRVFTIEPELLAHLLVAEELPEDARDLARRRVSFDLG